MADPKMTAQIVFEVTMVPEAIGAPPIVFYVKAPDASTAADKAEIVAEAARKAKLRVGVLKRLGNIVE